MSASPTNALSYNGYIQQLGLMVPVSTVETSGVYAFTDTNLASATPMILNYAELRIQRDLDMLSSWTSNTYTLTAGVNVFAIPVNDFLTVQTLAIVQLGGVGGTQVVNTQPLVAASKEFIQNCYGGLSNAGVPEYYAMYGDNFSTDEDTYTNILLGPTPSYPATLQVTGSTRAPSLYTYAQAGIADTTYTYISQWFPDLLLMASMIYVSAYQRNFSATSDDAQMGMTYEKQYQALRLGAIPEENRRKQQGSGWSSYSTPTAATPTR